VYEIPHPGEGLSPNAQTITCGFLVRATIKRSERKKGDEAREKRQREREQNTTAEH
jgi:hypothetical protein